MPPVVSVIIPIYNSGKFLKKCLQSVCEQSFNDIEIICVNDGSTDESIMILKRFAQIDSRIRIISHTHTKGCAAARNTGMQSADGKYLYFIDSDDWIDQCFLEALVCISEREDIDIIYNSNILLEYNDGTSHVFEPGNYNKYIGFETTGYVDSKINIGNFSYSTCCCLYRKSYVYKISASFPEGYDYTDNFFHIITFIHQDKIYVTNKPAYHYTIHDNSICRKNLEMMNYNIVEIYEMIYQYYINSGFIHTCKLNFFELSRYMPKVPYDEIRRLFLCAMPSIKKHQNLYRSEEIRFFKCIFSAKNYNDFKKYMEILDKRKLICYPFGGRR